MTPRARSALIGCGLAALALVMLAVGSVWWFLRGGPIVGRLDLVGPETQAFVTFLAEPEDRAVRDLVESVGRQLRGSGAEGRSEGHRPLDDFLAGARLSPVRASVMVEALPEGKSQLGFVISLGKIANLARMLLGIPDSERTIQIYRRERIILGRDKKDLAVSFVGNNLVLSREPEIIKRIIDRLKRTGSPPGPSAPMAAVLADLGSEEEEPGFGGMINDRASLASLWQMLTGAPEGSEIALPGTFEGVGFRFELAATDRLVGEGNFYFLDEESAAGAVPLLEAAIPRLLQHYRLVPEVEVRQQGRRLHMSVEASGLRAAIERWLQRHSRAASGTRPLDPIRG